MSPKYNAKLLTLNQKLELYFYNPYEGEDKYSNLFHTYTNQTAEVGYAPLYVLRRHILVLSGRLFKYDAITTPIYHTPYFSGILLSNILITGLAELIGMQDDFPNFYSTYLGKNEMQMLGLRLLRNSLEHTNFQLFTKVSRKSGIKERRKCFERLEEYFVRNGNITSSESVAISSYKVVFTLSENVREVVSLPTISIKPGIASANVGFTIRPFKFLEIVDQGVKKVELQIKKNQELGKKFNRKIQASDWMHVKN